MCKSKTVEGCVGLRSYCRVKVHGFTVEFGGGAAHEPARPKSLPLVVTQKAHH
jgi:hypothetical protein